MPKAPKKPGRSTASSKAFAELDQLITTLHPRHARTRRPPDLEPDAPARIRELWEAIGVSQASDALSVPLLTRAASEKELARIFEEWDASPKDRGAWGGGADSFREALPERIRLVRAWKDEVMVTDESRGDSDPAVLFMRQHTRRLVRLDTPYTEWTIWRLLGALTSTRQAEYNRLRKVGGKRILAQAYPAGLYQVAEGIWTMMIPRLPDVVEDPEDRMFYASLDRYLEYVLELPEKKRPLFGSPKASELWVSSSGPLDLEKEAPAGFGVWRSVGNDGRPAKHLNAIGPVGKTIVWLGMSPNDEEVQVKFNPTAQAAVETWVKGMGLKIKRPIPLTLWSKGRRQPYDLFGW